MEPDFQGQVAVFRIFAFVYDVPMPVAYCQADPALILCAYGRWLDVLDFRGGFRTSPFLVTPRAFDARKVFPGLFFAFH